MDKSQFFVGQLVTKIKHPSWINEHLPSMIELGSIGIVTTLEAQFGYTTGIGVKFPHFEPMVYEWNCMQPVKDMGKHKITWDQCCWKPKKEFLDKFDL